jgi:xylan 1,4-beta-xylosidase
MGSPQQPTREQYTQLEQAGQLALLTPPTSMAVDNGALVMRLELTQQAVPLLVFEWK